MLSAADIAAIRYSLAVAEHHGFRKAALALGVQESIVSRRVRRLEDGLQVSLFERHAYGVRLTVAGERFLEQAGAALSEITSAVVTARAVGRGEQGRLRLGFVASPSGGFLQQLLYRYRSDHPQVDVQFREGSRRLHLTMVRDRRLDLAITMRSDDALGCETARLWNEPIYVALPQNHELANHTQVAWLELKAERFILCQSDYGAEIYDCLVRHLNDLGQRPDIEEMAVSRETLLNLVELGIGVALVTESAAAAASINIKFRPVKDPPDGVTFSAVWSPENDNPALRQFISLAHVMAGRPRKGTSDWTGRAP